MSLILDALRKLEREKGSYEPGVLVVGSVPWGETSRARRLAVWAGAAFVLALAVLVAWLLRRSPAPAAAAHPASAAAPAPSPSFAPAAPVATPPPPAPPAEGAYVPPPIRLSHAPAAPAREHPPVTTPAQAVGAAEPAPSLPSAAEPAPAPTLAPAQPAVAPSSPTSDEPRLTAISQRDGKPVALINDRLLFEGDNVDGIRVIRIGETEVEIEFKGQRRVLRF